MQTLRRYLPYLLMIASLALAIWILRRNQGSLLAVWDVVRTANLSWLLIGLGCWLCWQVAQIFQMRQAYRLVGLPATFSALSGVTIANNFVNTFVPSANVSTFALFGFHAHRQRWKLSQSWLGLVIFALAEYTSGALVLAVALRLYRQQSGLHWLEFWPAIALIGGVALATVLIRLLIRNAEALADWLAQFEIGFEIEALETLANALNTLIQSAPGEAGAFVALRNASVLKWLTLYSCALLGKTAQFVLMWSVGSALGISLDMVMTWVTTAFSYLYTVVSPVPQGIGIVESAVSYQLQNFGIAQTSSVAVGILYRGYTLWLAALIGFVALNAFGLRAYQDVTPDVN